MSQKFDSRKKIGWEEPCAIPTGRIRKEFKYPVGKIDENFCKNSLWWWRPLLRCLDSDFKKTGNYLVEKNRRGRFPAHVFELMQAHHDADEMHSLLHLWRVGEIGERIEELRLDWLAGSDAWPAYKAKTDYYSSVAALKVVTLGPLTIDLSETDKDIQKRVQVEIERLRTEVALRDDRLRLAEKSNRNRHFNLAAFAIVEAIDRHTILGEEKEALPWANVRKAIKEAYE